MPTEPKIPGWLLTGLWLREKDTGTPFEVTEVTSLGIKLFSRDGSVAVKKELTDLHKTFVAYEYFQCDNCRRPERSKNLPSCYSCQERSRSFDGFYDLPRFCETPYRGGFVPLDEPAWATKLPTRDSIPTRFERDPVI